MTSIVLNGIAKQTNLISFIIIGDTCYNWFHFTYWNTRFIHDNVYWVIAIMIARFITGNIRSLHLYLILSIDDEREYYHLCKWCHNQCLYCCMKLDDEANDDENT